MQNKSWLFLALLFATVYSFLGFDWGVVSAHRLRLLAVQEPPRLLEDIAQFTKEKGYRVNLHVSGHEESPEELLYLKSNRHLEWNTHREEFLRIYRHYLAWSYSGDLSTSFGPLSTMHPKRFDFNPHSFQYGGAFLYPLAGIIQISSWLGLTHLVADANYYILHPLELHKLAQAGRALVVFAHLMTLVFIYKTASLWKGPLTGFLAATLYLFIPGPICLSREIKPHAYAVVWIAISAYYALRYLRENRKGDWMISTIGAGLAAGSCLNYGVSFISPILAIAGGPLEKRTSRLCSSLLLFGATLVLVNPYAVIRYDIFLQEMTALSRVFSLRPPTVPLTPWSNMFAYGAPWWLSLTAGVSLVGYWFSHVRRSEKVVMTTLPMAYIVTSYIASHGDCLPRFAILLYPSLAMLAASGLAWTIQKIKGVGIALTIAVVTLTCLKGTAYVVNFTQDSWGQSNVFKAAQFVSALPAGSTLGCLAFPAPGSFPPIPFYRYHLITFPDIQNLLQAPARDLPDYVVVTEDAITDIARYRLEKDFLPFSFGTTTLFKPDILSPGTPALRFRIFQKLK